MITVKVKSKKADYRELQNLPKNVRIAVLNAMRSVRAELKQQVITQTVQQYYLTKSQIRKAWQDTPKGFKVSSGMLTLDKYKLIPKSPRKKYVLRGAVKKASGIKPLGRNAFLLRAGRVLPAARLTKKRYPLKILAGPSIPQAVQGAFSDEETEGVLSARAEVIFQKKLNEALSRLGVKK